MLKKIQVVALLLIIFLTVVFGFFYVSLNLNYKFTLLEPVNENFRSYFIKNFTLRRAFRLSQQGDARSDYYSDKQFKKLKVEVYESEFGTLYSSSVNLITGGVDGIIDKPEGVSMERKKMDNVPKKVDDPFIDKLSDDIPRFSKNTAVLRIYILSTYKLHPSLVGLTTNAYGFIIFKESVEGSSTKRSLREDLEIETILHEIGHLLGSAHSNYEKCVMNKVVDVPYSRTSGFIPTKYCLEDLQAIKEANP